MARVMMIMALMISACTFDVDVNVDPETLEALAGGAMDCGIVCETLSGIGCNVGYQPDAGGDDACSTACEASGATNVWKCVKEEMTCDGARECLGVTI